MAYGRCKDCDASIKGWDVEAMGQINARDMAAGLQVSFEDLDTEDGPKRPQCAACIDRDELRAYGQMADDMGVM